jgi:hypothetical protein
LAKSLKTSISLFAGELKMVSILRACVPTPLHGGDSSATTVEIHSEKHGYYAFRFDRDGEYIAVTWHMSLQEAKEQLKFEYPGVDFRWYPIETTP